MDTSPIDKFRQDSFLKSSSAKKSFASGTKQLFIVRTGQGASEALAKNLRSTINKKAYQYAYFNSQRLRK